MVLYDVQVRQKQYFSHKLQADNWIFTAKATLPTYPTYIMQVWLTF